MQTGTNARRYFRASTTALAALALLFETALCAGATGGASPVGEAPHAQAGSATNGHEGAKPEDRGPTAPHGADAGSAGAGSPHGGMTAPHAASDAAFRDHSSPDTSVPAGTIDVTIADGSARPVAGVPVKLEVLKTSIASGNVTATRTAVSDDRGVVRFSGENTQTDYSYRVIVERSPALYASNSFLLQRSVGQRVVLNLYPVTRTLAGALVIMAQQTSIEPKEGRFRFATTIDVQNFGRFALVPENLRIRLPKGAEAFQASTDETDRQARLEGDSVELEGTYPPGAHRVSYAFDVPSAGAEKQVFDVGVAPFLRSMTLAVEAAPAMSVSVPALSQVVERQHSTGQRLLLAQRDYLARRERSPDQLQVTLQGLPTPSPARKFTAVLAGIIAIAGVGRWWRSRNVGTLWRGVPDADLEHAKKLLLDELVALEKAHDDERIGPRTYERARQALLDSLSRLLARPTSGAR